MQDKVESILGVEPKKARPLSRVAEPSLWSFQGRIGRGSFWARFFTLLLFNFMASILMYAIGDSSVSAVIVIYLAYAVFAVWFGLSFQVKRWHDLDKSGWMVLLNFTIIALPVVLIILGCIRGTQGPNRYGIDPLPSGVSLNLKSFDSPDAAGSAQPDAGPKP